MASDWDKIVEAGKAELAKVSGDEVKGQIIGTLSIFEGAIDKLLAAEDQVAFDREMETIGQAMSMFGFGGGSRPNF